MKSKKSFFPFILLFVVLSLFTASTLSAASWVVYSRACDCGTPPDPSQIKVYKSTSCALGYAPGRRMITLAGYIWWKDSEKYATYEQANCGPAHHKIIDGRPFPLGAIKTYDPIGATSGHLSYNLSTCIIPAPVGFQGIGGGRTSILSYEPLSTGPTTNKWCEDDVTDTDGDLSVDCVDNCDNAINTDQNDFDKDGQGDACDPDTVFPDLEFGIEPPWTGNTPGNCKQNMVGNPVNIFNGNNSETQTDVTFNSPFDNGFRFSRFYNSQSSLDSPVGMGWSHDFHIVLTPYVNGNPALLTITDGTGRGYYFQDNDGDMVFDGGFSETSSVFFNPDNNFVWHRYGTVYDFGVKYRLDLKKA